jgi:hypothetical protein
VSSTVTARTQHTGFTIYQDAIRTIGLLAWFKNNSEQNSFGIIFCSDDFATGQLTYHMLPYGAGFSRNNLSPKTLLLSSNSIRHLLSLNRAGIVSLFHFLWKFGYSAVAREPPQDIFAPVSTQLSAGRKLAKNRLGTTFICSFCSTARQGWVPPFAKVSLSLSTKDKARAFSLVASRLTWQ